MRASWKRARKVAIWALVTVSEGKNVPAAVPLAILKEAMQPMPAARVESAGASSKEAPAAASEHSLPAASQARAKNVARGSEQWVPAASAQPPLRGRSPYCCCGAAFS